jgi:hypothetical protein
MAVLDSLPGIEVTICNDGAPLSEYPDLEDDSVPDRKHRVVTNYIQSSAGVPFSFTLKVGPPYEHDCDYLGFFITLDGETDEVGHLCGRDQLEENPEWEEEVRGNEIVDADGIAKLKKFKFTELTLSMVLILLRLKIDTNLTQLMITWTVCPRR